MIKQGIQHQEETIAKRYTGQGHFSRLRQRFLDGGLDGFLDYEVLELLLSLANRKDCKKPAKDLMAAFGSLGAVLSADMDRLQKVAGVGARNSLGIVLIQAVSRRYLKESVRGTDCIRSSTELLNYLTHRLRDNNREVFMVILLDGRNRVIELEELFEGTLTASVVYTREVVKLILNQDAAAVIFAHNHPSGNPKPSNDDRLITRKLQQACEAIDVRVHDHLIIAGNESVSFAEKGWM